MPYAFVAGLHRFLQPRYTNADSPHMGIFYIVLERACGAVRVIWFHTLQQTNYSKMKNWVLMWNKVCSNNKSYDLTIAGYVCFFLHFSCTFCHNVVLRQVTQNNAWCNTDFNLQADFKHAAYLKNKFKEQICDVEKLTGFPWQYSPEKLFKTDYESENTSNP